MLPRNLLETPYAEGRLARMWSVGRAADAVGGLGAFGLREYVRGQRVTLERIPFYWKTDRAGTRLPYLDRLVFVFVPSEDAQALRFQAGDADVTTRLSATNFEVLMRDRGRRNYDLLDAGPGLDYTFLFFNQNTVAPNDAPDVARRRAWFRQLAFRQAVSLAIDRDAIVRLVYRGRATPLWGHVPPGNKLWVNRSLPRPPRSLDRARQRLRSAGFSLNAAGALVDKDGQAVDFTIVTNTGNTERIQIATIVQEDLKQIGIRVGVVTLELRTLLQRLLATHDYDACVLALGASDGDPSSEMNVWLSSGGNHLWKPEQGSPAKPWVAQNGMSVRHDPDELQRHCREQR